MKRVQEESILIARNIQSEEDSIKDALYSLPIKRRALQDLNRNIQQLQSQISSSEKTNSNLEFALLKSNSDIVQSYTSLMETLPEKLCGICMDTNLNSPHAAVTKLGCACQVNICTPCFGLLITELHKKPLCMQENSFLCFACQTPVPALRMAYTSFLSSLSNSPHILKAHVNVYQQDLIARDAQTAQELALEENFQEEYLSALPPLPESESDTGTEDTLEEDLDRPASIISTEENQQINQELSQELGQQIEQEIQEDMDLSIEEMIHLLDS